MQRERNLENTSLVWWRY